MPTNPRQTASLLLLPLLAVAGLCAGQQGPRGWNHRAVGADVPTEHAGNSVVVAVLDSGVYAQADALRETRVLRGKDFVEQDQDATDDNGHGTHIASLIAGRIGDLAPLCSECAILPVKVLDERGLGDIETLARGLRWAVDQGADVVNMSMGFDPGYDPGAELREAVAYAVRRDVVLVASVGNEGRPGITYPAGYPGVIAVAAVDYDERRTAYSNLSPAVDVAAPGGDDRDRDGDGVPESILSDGLRLHGRGAEPWLYSGTSQAAAHVSALAGRLLAHGAAAERVEPLLIASARDVGVEGFDLGTGAGLIDFPAALALLEHEPGEDELPWTRRYRWEARGAGPGRLQVQIRDLRDRPVPGAVLFGHWRGSSAVIVSETDTLGRIELDLRGARPGDLVVDRIHEQADASEAVAFLPTRLRPYQGILASPLSRFPR